MQKARKKNKEKNRDAKIGSYAFSTTDDDIAPAPAANHICTPSGKSKFKAISPCCCSSSSSLHELHCRGNNIVRLGAPSNDSKYN